MNTPPLVSVILPVYNVQKHLVHCLNSLSAIDYAPLEIILVDDASTDECGMLCEEFRKSHPAVTVIHHDRNLGVSCARITGYDASRGDFIMFVDPDDYVHPAIVSRMVISALANQADIVCCQIYDTLGEIKKVLPGSLFGVFHKDDLVGRFQSNLLFNSFYQNSSMPLYIFGKLFRRELLERSLRLGEGLHYGEDTLTVVDYLLNRTETLVCLDDPLYYYVNHPGQVTAKPLLELWPFLLPYWRRMDALGGDLFFQQLAVRIWTRLKPSVYDKPEIWGGVWRNNGFIRMFREVRNEGLLKKYLWNNPGLSRSIRRHPHYFLLKHRLYYLDYFLYYLLWLRK